MSKSKMDAAFRAQLQRPRIRMTAADHSRLDAARDFVGELESRSRDSERDDIRQMWFYYGWQACERERSKKP